MRAPLFNGARRCFWVDPPWLTPRTPTAPGDGCLWLLRSSPDQVHRPPVHRARASTRAGLDRDRRSPDRLCPYQPANAADLYWNLGLNPVSSTHDLVWKALQKRTRCRRSIPGDALELPDPGHPVRDPLSSHPSQAGRSGRVFRAAQAPRA